MLTVTERIVRRRPFTPEEDATIRKMARDGHTTSQIAGDLGRQIESVVKRARVIGAPITHGTPGRRRGPAESAMVGHCARCTILLVCAPAGHDGLCGWCVTGQ